MPESSDASSGPASSWADRDRDDEGKGGFPGWAVILIVIGVVAAAILALKKAKPEIYNGIVNMIKEKLMGSKK